LAHLFLFFGHGWVTFPCQLSVQVGAGAAFPPKFGLLKVRFSGVRETLGAVAGSTIFESEVGRPELTTRWNRYFAYSLWCHPRPCPYGRGESASGFRVGGVFSPDNLDLLRSSGSPPTEPPNVRRCRCDPEQPPRPCACLCGDFLFHVLPLGFSFTIGSCPF